MRNRSSIESTGESAEKGSGSIDGESSSNMKKRNEVEERMQI